MLTLWPGAAAFGLFILYDVNSIRWRRRWLNGLFPAGLVLLAASAAADLWLAWRQGAIGGAADVLLLIAAAAALGGLMYCLFFALPFDETYREATQGRRVYDRGVYALCRHPGVLFLAAAYLLAGLAALPYGPLLINGTVFTALNVLYVLFQDRVTFPATFIDYENYRQKVPFLLPTRASAAMARKTIRSHKEEDDA